MLKNISKPTDSELAILQVLWKNGPSSVKTVNESINKKKKDVGYTTTLKLLQIMLEKGLVTREAEGKLHIYKCVPKENFVKKNFIKDVVEQVFNGSAMDLVIQTLGNYKANQKEISDLKNLIKDLEQKQK